MNAQQPTTVSPRADLEIVTLQIAGYPVLRHNSESLLREIHTRLSGNRQTSLFFANTNFIVQCRDLRDALHNRNVLIVNDGIGMDLAAQLTHGQRFIENLNGTDFIPLLMRTSPTPLRVFLYGGKPESVAKATAAIAAMGQTVSGYIDGYQSDQNKVRQAIETAQADVVLVAMGNPLQERWILQNADTLSPRIFIGVGALFDFLSGQAQRAPTWIRKLRMEWFYRLCREPRRLGRRYTLDTLIFFKLCLAGKQRKN